MLTSEYCTAHFFRKYFNRLVSDLINDKLQTNDACVFLKLYLLLYTDDTIITAESATERQDCLNASHYCNLWSLKKLIQPIYIIFHLLYHTVYQFCYVVVKYGGMRNVTTSLQKRHLEFCRMVLHVNKSTSKYMIYGELGRPPLVIQLKQRMANFWIKLAQGKYSKLSVIMYRLLFNLNNKSEYELP